MFADFLRRADKLHDRLTGFLMLTVSPLWVEALVVIAWALCMIAGSVELGMFWLTIAYVSRVMRGKVQEAARDE